MKTYSSRRELLERVQNALAEKPRLAERGRKTLAASLVQRAPGVLNQVASILQSGRDYLHVAIYLDGGTLLVRRGMAGAHTDCTTMKYGEGVVGRVAESGRVRMVPDVAADSNYKRVLKETRSELVTPVRIAGRVFAVIDCESDHPNPFSYQDRVLLSEVASKLAVFLGTRGKFLLLEARDSVLAGLAP